MFETLEKFIKGTIAAIAVVACTATGALADWPKDTITIVVGFRQGGGLDTQVRSLAQKIEKDLGVSVIVENRSGGGGAVAATYLKTKPSDGYTLGASAFSTFTFNTLKGKTNFTADEFRYVGTLFGLRTSLLARSENFKDWKSMVKFAKKRGYLTYASVFPFDRTIMEQIAKKEGFELDIIPTKGGSGARAALLAGDVEVALSGASGFSLIGQNGVFMIATPDRQRVPKYSYAPTLLELGYDGFAAEAAIIFAPGGVSDEIAKKINDMIRKVTMQPDFVKQVRRINAMPLHLTVGQLEKEVKQQQEGYRKLLKETGS